MAISRTHNVAKGFGGNVNGEDCEPSVIGKLPVENRKNSATPLAATDRRQFNVPNMFSNVRE
jgi:hypothetical protein